MLTKNTIKLIQQLDQKKHRQANGLFVVEGEKMVIELLTSPFNTQAIFCLNEFKEKHGHLLKNADQTLVNEIELKKISQLKTPNQVVALAEIPNSETNNYKLEPGLFVALDNVQDPGNLGTIIRASNWFGVDAVFCSPQTADAYNSKVVQSTMGAIFKTPVIYTDLSQLLNEAKQQKLPIFGTLLSGTNLYEKKLPEHGIILMGNESKGLSGALAKQVDEKILIPSFEQGGNQAIESLNVAIATSIVLAEFRRQLL